MRTYIISIVALLSFFALPIYAQSDKEIGHNAKMTMNQDANDTRISLGLSPRMKAHQLENMRSHIEAVQMIVGLIARGNFDKASEISHSKLGLTEDMKRMCNMFQNKSFRALGLQFHKSADELAETLKTRDIKKSLNALHKTMGYCVQCHATFRQ